MSMNKVGAFLDVLPSPLILVIKTEAVILLIEIRISSFKQKERLFIQKLSRNSTQSETNVC